MKTPAKRQQKTGIELTWFGHSAFRIVTHGGTTIFIDPWLDNPKAPAIAKSIERADLILVTHGHGDHIGNVFPLAKKTGAKVICNHEIAEYFEKAGLSNIDGINKSGCTTVGDIRVTMVDATHSSGIEVDGKVLAGGDPAGFVIECEKTFTVYHAGDTGLFGDMKLIAELYRPDLALLPIGGYFTMGPREAAKACELIQPRFIVGMHYGTYPILSGTPEELKKYLPAKLKGRVRVLQPGVPCNLA